MNFKASARGTRCFAAARVERVRVKNALWQIDRRELLFDEYSRVVFDSYKLREEGASNIKILSAKGERSLSAAGQPTGRLNATYDRVTTINAFGPDPNEFIGELALSILLALLPSLWLS